MECKYLEIIEQTEDLEVEPKTVRIKVESKTEAEDNLYDAIKEFEGKKYIARLHTCRHSKDGKNRPCSVEILKEVI